MELNMKKCSSKEHFNINAFLFCNNCQVYLCKKCESFHSNLFQNHSLFKLDQDIKDIFTGYCQKDNHNQILEFYCKTHNELCCASCICVLKGRGKGFHSSCEICFLEDIKEDKKNKLKDNINTLEELTIKLDESINKLKNAFNKINERKEKIKNKFMEMFTKLRNLLNQTEDEILLDIDNEFKNNFFGEDFVKNAEKLPKKIKISLEKGKKVDDGWGNEKKLNLLINDCIKIEKNIQDIKTMNGYIEKFKNSDENIHIKYEEKNYDDEMNYYLQILKNIFIENKSNIYIKQNEMEKEINDLNEKISHLYDINFLIKFSISEYSFAFLSRINEATCFDTSCSGKGYSPHLWEFQSNNVNQIFTIFRNKDGTYLIKNKHSGYFVGMEDKNGEWEFVMREKGENYQKFKFIHVEKDYFLIENEKGKFIDLIYNDTQNGAQIKPNDKTNSLGQQWKIHLLK